MLAKHSVIVDSELVDVGARDELLGIRYLSRKKWAKGNITTLRVGIWLSYCRGSLELRYRNNTWSNLKHCNM